MRVLASSESDKRAEGCGFHSSLESSASMLLLLSVHAWPLEVLQPQPW